MRRFVLPGTGVLLFLIVGTMFLGCGGGAAVGPAIGINLTPTDVSLNRGATAQITAQALTTNNVVVSTPDLAYHSDNPAITVSSSGLICAGQWDAKFVTCYTCSNPDPVTNQCPANNSNLLPLTPPNQPARITATSTQGNVTLTSSAVLVTVHEPIDSVEVIPDPSNPSPCVSQAGLPPANTAKFTARAFSNDPASCQRITGSANVPCQVPNGTIGNINWALSPATVATADAANKTVADPVVVTSLVPGQGRVVGSVGALESTVSGSSTFTTCAVASIHVQTSTTPASTSFTAPVSSTVTLAPIVLDSQGNTLNLSTSTLGLTWLSSQPALASVSLGTVNTAAPGTAEITAACLPPSCNINFVPLQPIYSDNAVTANITGTTDSTVLVTTSTPPANTASSNSIVPIDTTTNTPGTGFVLPQNLIVNSMVITPAGDPVFLGGACTAGTITGAGGAACSGLVRFDPTVAAISAPTTTITGAVLATDGTHVVVSDPTTNQMFIVVAAGPSVEATLPINVSSLIAPSTATPPGAMESGNAVTLTTTTPHGLTTGQSVLVAGVGVAGYNGVFPVTVLSPTSLTYTAAPGLTTPSGGGYVTGGVSAAISPDGSKIYVVTGQGSQQSPPGGTLYVYHTGEPLLIQNLGGGGSVDPTSTQAVSFFPTGIMGYIANSSAHVDDVVALTPPSNCNDAIASTIAVGNSPTHIAAVPNAGLFPFGSPIPAMVDANSPNIDEIDVDATSASVCPLALSNSFTTVGFGVGNFTARQLIMTPDSKLALILSDKGVLVYNVGTKQPSVITLTGGPPAPQPLSGAVTPDSANLYVGATDGKVHRIDLTKTPPADAQSIAVNLCPSVTTGCNPDFLVVKPVATVATLTSLAVTPVNPTLSSAGQTQQFTATGTFSDRTTRDMTSFVTWASSNPVVAVIGVNTAVTPPLTTPGLARALATGTTTISATSAGVSGSTTLTVQ